MNKFSFLFFSFLAGLNFTFALIPPIDGWSALSFAVGVLCTIVAVIEYKEGIMNGPR